MNINRDYDRIRNREDDRALDAKYGAQPDGRDEFWILKREQVAIDVRLERIDACLSELRDARKCQREGTLDYVAAGGILVEYVDLLIELCAKELK